MKFSNIEDSLPLDMKDDDYEFVQTLCSYNIGNESFDEFKSEYIEPITDAAKAVGKSFINIFSPITKGIKSVIDKYKAKSFIIKKVEEKLREDDLLDRLLSGGMIKVTITKVDGEFYIKVKSKSDERVRYFLINHQLNRNGNDEFERFKEILKDKIPKLIRKAKSEFKLDIANESVDRILTIYGEIYGSDKLEELMDKLK